jgi:hypothetical protein
VFRGFYLAVLAVSIVASIAAGPCAAGTFTTDDIEYEMPEAPEVKEDVFLFNPGGEWTKAYDPEKDDTPKYNLAAKFAGKSRSEGVLTSLMFFGRIPADETNALFAIQQGKNPLEKILADDIEYRKTMGRYIPLGTTKRTVAGCDAIVHDLSIEKGKDVFLYRLCFVAVPAADDTPARTYAPAIFHFVFSSHRKDSFNAAKPAMDALLDLMKLQDPLPEISPAPPFFDPRKGIVFRSYMDNFTVTLPEGAKEDKNPRLDPSDKGGESRTYTFKDAVILLSVFLSELDGEAAVTSLMDELEAVRKSASSWSVQGRKVPVSLYAAAEGQALVTALFERDNLLIAVLLPKDEYKEAQGWIKRLITGVTFD